VEHVLIIIVVGIVAGWLAGQITRGTGFGVVADLFIGIVGAWIGNWLLHDELGIHRITSSALLNQVITATIGAVLLLLILGLFRSRRRL